MDNASKDRVLPEVLLLRYVAGDLPAEQVQQIDALCRESEPLRQRVEAVRADHARFFTRHPSNAFAREVAQAMAARAPTRQHSWYFLLLAPSAAACATLLIGVFVTRWAGDAPPLATGTTTMDSAEAPQEPSAQFPPTGDAHGPDDLPPPPVAASPKPERAPKAGRHRRTAREANDLSQTGGSHVGDVAPQERAEGGRESTMGAEQAPQQQASGAGAGAAKRSPAAGGRAAEDGRKAQAHQEVVAPSKKDAALRDTGRAAPRGPSSADSAFAQDAPEAMESVLPEPLAAAPMPSTDMAPMEDTEEPPAKLSKPQLFVGAHRLRSGMEVRRADAVRVQVPGGAPVYALMAVFGADGRLAWTSAPKASKVPPASTHSLHLPKHLKGQQTVWLVWNGAPFRADELRFNRSTRTLNWPQAEAFVFNFKP